jgi:hypothetical protein
MFWMLMLLFFVTCVIALAGQRLLERHSSRGGEKMNTQRKWTLTSDLTTLHLYDDGLLHKAQSERRLAIGLLIFSLAFCALVFREGFKEVWAHGKCNLNGGTNCSIAASGTSPSP